MTIGPYSRSVNQYFLVRSLEAKNVDRPIILVELLLSTEYVHVPC